jgi:hypothetical protein
VCLRPLLGPHGFVEPRTDEIIMTEPHSLTPYPPLHCAHLFRVKTIFWTEATRWVFAPSRAEAIEAAEREYHERGRENFLITGEGLDHSKVTDHIEVGGCA